MAKMTIMLGLPGSGKSTFVDKNLIPLGYQLICADDLRLAHGHKFYGPLEGQIHGMLYTQARAQMLRGLNVVIDECTTKATYLKRWLHLAEDMRYDVEAIYMTTPKEVCIERRKLQNPDFPLDVIDLKAKDFALNIGQIRVLFTNQEWREICA